MTIRDVRTAIFDLREHDPVPMPTSADSEQCHRRILIQRSALGVTVRRRSDHRFETVRVKDKLTGSHAPVPMLIS